MTRALFVADQFSDAQRSSRERHPGGAELTDEAAISACPWPLQKLTCQALEGSAPAFFDDFDVIVLGNTRSASPALLARIARTGRHVLFEHDLRICRYRGNLPVARDPWHRSRQRCWCPHLEQRELFDRALGAIFLTHFQERYYRRNPFFSCPQTRVLGSSLFRPGAFDPAPRAPAGPRTEACVFASPHRIKGFRQALAYCRAQGISPQRIKNLPPQAVLDVFAACRRFVYLPIGPEWAGRMVVEARLLGCEVVSNDWVGVTGEQFWGSTRDEALEFLRDGPGRFWRLVEALMDQNGARPERATSRTELALDKLSWLLHAAPLRLWPAGPAHGELPPPRVYSAW